MSEPCDLSAVTLRRLIGRKTLSAAELLESCRARIDAVNPHLNALVADRFEAATAEAALADEATQRGDPLPLLHGLPIAVKESQHVAGMRSTQGSPLFADNWREADDSTVCQMKTSGAIIIGKTNLPELQHGMTSDNTLFGLTRNPFDPQVTCNGSSGGAAVAQAVAMAPLCSGSDTGGSIRGPAATNGVWGMRPSPGLVARQDADHVFNPGSVIGPFARDADDLALFLAGMMHTDPSDPYSWAMPRAEFLSQPQKDSAEMRVAVSADLGCVEIDPDIRATFEAKVGKIAGSFGSVTYASPDLGDVVQAFWILRPFKFMAAMGDAYKADPTSMTEYKRVDFRRGFAVTSERIAWAMSEQSRAFRSLRHFMEDYDVLITPGWASKPLTLSEIADREVAMARGNAAAGPFDYDFSRPEPSRSINPPITMTAHPVITAPAGLGPTGHPFAFNLIGRYRGDAALIAAARGLAPVLDADAELRRPIPDIATLSRKDA